jgi:hypothetical protein
MWRRAQPFYLPRRSRGAVYEMPQEPMERMQDFSDEKMERWCQKSIDRGSNVLALFTDDGWVVVKIAKTEKELSSFFHESLASETFGTPKVIEIRDSKMFQEFVEPWDVPGLGHIRDVDSLILHSGEIGLSPSAFWNVVRQVLEWLAALPAGARHNDLHGNNVLITHHGRVRVIDLGLATTPGLPNSVVARAEECHYAEPFAMLGEYGVSSRPCPAYDPHTFLASLLFYMDKYKAHSMRFADEFRQFIAKTYPLGCFAIGREPVHCTRSLRLSLHAQRTLDLPSARDLLDAIDDFGLG